MRGLAAGNTCPSQKVQTPHGQTTFGSSNRCRPLWCEVQTVSTSDHVWTFRCRFAWYAHGILNLVKVSETLRFCRSSTNVGRRGTFEEDLHKAAYRMAGAVQETCSSEMLGGQGADFLRDVAVWSVPSSGLLR